MAHSGTLAEVKCLKCKHDIHPANDCSERVCDAAGDMDWCPCGAGTKAPYLACPYCPAQSLPVATFGLRTSDKGKTMVTRYECPSKHSFYIEKEAPKENKLDD